MISNFARTVSINQLIYRAAVKNFICRALPGLLICAFVTAVAAAASDGETASEKQQSAAQASETWSAESYHRSITLYQEAATAWENAGEFQKAAVCLRESAQLAQLVSDYESASESLMKAVSLDDRENFVEGKVISLSLLSLISRQSGAVKKSATYYRQALELSRVAPTDAAQANALYSAGIYNFYHGDLAESSAYFQQAAALAEKTADIRLTSQILFYVGFSYGREGKPLQGLEFMRAALQKCRVAGYRRGETLAYFGIGFLSVLADEKQNALDAYRQAEAMFPADFEWLERGKLYSNIAFVHEEYGEADIADVYLRKAFEFYEKAGYPYGRLALLPSLAKIRYLKGDIAAARKLYQDALVLAAELHDPFHAAVVKEGLGDLDLRSDLYDRAIDNYRAALKIYRKRKIKLPRVENSLGAAFERKGDLTAAREFYESALKTNRAIKDTFSGAENLYNLARLNQNQGRTAAALEQIEESLRFTENLYKNVSNRNLQSSYISRAFDRYGLHVKLLMEAHRQSPDKNYAARALQAAEQARARRLLENLALSEADFLRDAAPETVRREKEIRLLLDFKAEQLTKLLSNSGDRAEIEKLDGEIAALDHDFAEIKATLRRNSPLYSAIKNPSPFDVEAFQGEILDDNSLLLEFALGESESYLWLVGKTEIEAYALPSRARIEERVEKLRGLLAARFIRPNESIEDFQARLAAAENEYRIESKNLSDDLFGQIAEKLGSKRLIVVPDGKLHLLPVAALPLPRSIEDAPIVLTNEAIYEPSAATLALLRRNKREIIAPNNLLVFSDPIFSAADARVVPASAANETPPADFSPSENFRFTQFPTKLVRLNASEDEGETILEIVGATDSTVFSGAAATREKVLDGSIAGYKIVHFATHNFVDEQRPEISGIVLSQADESGQSRNGVVRLRDVYAMNLAADAVVLSACGTGIGKELKGEGLLSLNNAFLQTGAKSVVASLWQVEDYAARELMENFYRELTAGATTSQALRQAQIKLRENPQYQSPFYWAAFTTQGDVGVAPRLPKKTDYRIFAWLVFPSALLAILIYRRRNKSFDRKVINKS